MPGMPPSPKIGVAGLECHNAEERFGIYQVHLPLINHSAYYFQGHDRSYHPQLTLIDSVRVADLESNKTEERLDVSLLPVSPRDRGLTCVGPSVSSLFTSVVPLSISTVKLI
jgi:hypothetical protein